MAPHQHDRKPTHPGFDKYTPVNEALKTFLNTYTKNHFQPKTEYTTLQYAANRVLAEDFISPIDIPPFTKSAMDGYAVIANNTAGASPSHPISLGVAGKASAGDATAYKVGPSQCVAIATGARIPQGADAVVMVEDTAVDVEDGAKRNVKVFKEVESGKNVIVKGEDVKKDKVLLQRGTWLRPQDVGLIASVGVQTVPVYRRPKVAVFSTGSELVEPGSTLMNDATLYDSNRYMLSSMIKDYGGDAIDLGICRDDEGTIQSVLKRALFCDLVVMSGGSSVGEKDYVPAVINKAGAPGVLVHGVAMRPGSPTALSMVEGKPVISTPGYPVAAFFAFYTFGRPILLSMLGTSGLPEAKVTAKMAAPIELREGMRAFVRVKLKAVKDADGNVSYVAEPRSAAAASIQSTLTDSDGVVIADNQTCLTKDQKVEVILLRAIGTC